MQPWHVTTVRRLGLVVLAIFAIAVAAWWFSARRHGPQVHTAVAGAGASSEHPHTADQPAVVRDAAISRVQRLAPDERRLLGEQIAAALRTGHASTRAGASAGATVNDDVPDIPLEAVGAKLQSALRDAIPLLAECYEHRGSETPRTAAARMTMISDPQLGTVIDTDAVADAAGSAIDRELDTCLRDAIDSLELPPLGQPGKVKLEYTFRFDP
jgi:hypothetical protein